MNQLDELRETITELAAHARTERIPRWHSSVQLVISGAPWVVCTASASGLAVTDGGAEAATVVEMTPGAVERWLLDGVDFTHLVKAGEFVITRGTYFDLLLLSKALGLRSDRRVRDGARDQAIAR